MELRETPQPVQKAPETTLLKPRIENKPSNPEASSLLTQERDVSIRMVNNLAIQKLSDHDPTTLDQAVETNADGIGTLQRFNKLIEHQEVETYDPDKNTSPLDLGKKIAVRDTQGTERKITKVLGRNGDTFICEGVKPNGEPEGDFPVQSDEVLRAQLISDETELTSLLSEPSVTEDERAVFEEFMRGLKGDTAQLEDAASDPSKRQEIRNRISSAEENNGMLSDRTINKFVDHIAPERTVPEKASPEAIQFVEQSNEKRQKLKEIADDPNLSKGEKIAKIGSSDIPDLQRKANEDVEALKIRLSQAETKEEKSKIQKELSEANDHLTLLNEVNTLINPSSPDQESGLAQIIDQMQNGSVQPSVMDDLQEAVQAGNMEKLIEITFDNERKNISLSREQQERNTARKEKLKKGGKISIAVLVALLAAGGMAAKGGLQEE